MKKTILTFYFVTFLLSGIFAQNKPKLDSLFIALKSAKHDTIKINLLQKIGLSFLYINPDSAIHYYKKAIIISEKIGEENKTSVSLNVIGTAHAYQGKYNIAIENWGKALKIDLKKGNLIRAAKCYTNIGLVYSYQGLYDKALENQLKAIKIFEKIEIKKNKNIQKGMAACYLNTGIVYSNLEQYDNALYYYHKSLKINNILRDQSAIIKCNNNIGTVYQKKGDLIKAKDYYQKALTHAKILDNKESLAFCHNNLGVILSTDAKNYNTAMQHHKNGLQLNKEIKNNNEIAKSYGNISELYLKMSETNNEKIHAKYLDSTIIYGHLAYNTATEGESIASIKIASEKLFFAYKIKKQYPKAIKYADIYIQAKDSMFNIEKTKALVEMEAKYESEKKQLLIENLNKENMVKTLKIEKSEEERSKEKILMYSFLVGFIIIIIFFIIIYRLFLQKKKANIFLAKQKEELISQRDEITIQRDMMQKQKEHIEYQKQRIDDSIRYAKHIQTSVLPAIKQTSHILGNHFIVFKPKDIVSGDFYWFTQVNNWVIITVSDCTGHGVPGAFMSMLGITFLNEIVRKKEVTKASDVLNLLRDSIIEALGQNEEKNSQKDGMDISFAAINKNTKQCHWAGANNPLWIIKSNTKNLNLNTTDIINITKADNMPIGKYIKMKPFTNHTIQLENGDKLYLFSDGFADQFGGPKGKKYMHKRFKQIIAKTSELPINQQGTALENELYNWMNYNEKQYEQIDDITVIGLEI